MVSVLIAQFFSALADNAILIVAISIVKAQGMNGLVSMLQESFKRETQKKEFKVIV
jgi:hypothetical protein